MKIKLLLSALCCILSPVVVHADGGGHGHDRVSIESEVKVLQASDKIAFSFQIFDNESKKEITDTDLKLSHTKKVHFIVYDAALKEFNHVHPEFVNGLWQTELNLPVNGAYFIWAQGTLNDGAEFSVSNKLKVEGGKSPWSVTNLGDHRKETSNHTTVELSQQKIRAGKMIMLTYRVSRDDGSLPVVTPYLGANAHVIAISPDGKDLIHVHPMDGQDTASGMLHATFPRVGDYRMWVQLNDHDELKTVPLSVTVVE
ncbi:hypothetical protein [Pseudobdellovibrio sp. HCB154]|uniref:hypothetical protein n=1 Tax=Pseudobdellovibrio sp. HCB154 TaxID=3386277 RepID=UPI0039176510